jgi:organic radical activating enzyme
MTFIGEIDKKVLTKVEAGTHLPIMEDFYTIQGEGANTGMPSYFIRLGGCDVGCHWCDVKESWDPTIHPVTNIDTIISRVQKHPSKDVIITGGEPSAFNLKPLTTKLVDLGYRTYIETSGAYEMRGVWHWICLSPKKTKKPVQSSYAKAHELKVIVFNKHDFKWAEQEAVKVTAGCKLYLQPEWSKREELTPLIIDYVKNNPKWQISLQTHKFLNIP